MLFFIIHQNETNAQVHFFAKNILVQSLMTSSFEWLNGTPRADLPILTFVRSATAQVRKNKFSTLVQSSQNINFG